MFFILMELVVLQRIWPERQVGVKSQRTLKITLDFPLKNE